MTDMLRKSVTIPEDAAFSEGVQISAYNAIGLAVQTPAALTACDIGFEVSMDGENWIPIKDAENNRVIIDGPATAAAGVYAVSAHLGWIVDGYRHIRLASLNTSTGAALNQDADRTLIIVFMPLSKGTK